MKKILFVDDEQAILDGLKNLLRRQRHEWQMEFALGGEQAVNALATQPFDVIVSDMRMPGIDGPALLAHAKRFYPSMARIVLSGHAERDAMLSALPLAHQFLAKPCDAQTLRHVIQQTCNLQELLTDTAIREVLGKLDKLPSAPRAYIELTQVLGNPKTSIGQIAEIVIRDPAMAAKVLQVVNSTYFGMQHRVTSVKQAITSMGTDMLKGIALTAGVFDSSRSALHSVLPLDALQAHSLRTAHIARNLFADKALADDAFTAAIVHDIGKILVALARPDELRKIQEEVRKGEKPEWQLEQERIGVTHAQLGGYLLGVWGLPTSIVETVAFHHARPLNDIEQPELLAAVHFADALDHGNAIDDALVTEGLRVKWTAVAQGGTTQ